MPLPDDILALHRSLDVIDVHCHPSLPVYLFGRKLYGGGGNKSSPELDPAVLPQQMATDYLRMRGGGVGAIWSSIYVPEKKFVDACPGLRLLKLIEKGDEILSHDPYDLAVRILLMMNKEVADAIAAGAKIGIARNFAAFEFLRNEGSIALMHSIEGAHHLGIGLKNRQEYFDRLDKFIEYGIVSMTLGHFFPNDVCSPVNGLAPSIHDTLKCLPSVFNPGLQLTPLGRDVVTYLLDHGVIVDLNHVTPAGRWDVINLNRARGAKMRPIVYTHIGVRALCPNEMSTPEDDEIKAIADTNGIIGIISMGYWLNGDEHGANGMDLIVKTAKHIRDLVGIEHVAIGSDFDGFTDPCDDFFDSSMYPYLTQGLVQGGFTDDEVRAVLGGNARRVLKEGWGAGGNVA